MGLTLASSRAVKCNKAGKQIDDFVVIVDFKAKNDVRLEPECVSKWSHNRKTHAEKTKRISVHFRRQSWSDFR
jgi:hypothetical protein